MYMIAPRVEIVAFVGLKKPEAGSNREHGTGSDCA